MSEHALRAVAVLIALAGLIDPSLTVERRVVPLVELHVAPGEEDFAASLEDLLAGRFELEPAPVAGAAARVVVGAMLPPAATVPTFVVVAERPVIAAVDAPVRASLHGRVPVRVTVRSPGFAGAPAGSQRAGSAGDVVVRLLVGGMVADRADLAELAPGPDGTYQTTLTFTPTAAGPQPVRVTAGESWADTLIVVDDTPWRVLAHDPRPSWMATFVRRALESDPRFEVAARVEAAPRSVVASGAPPRLADAGALAAYDAIVAGAPDALTDADVDALADFMRRRGGAVVLLIDSAPGAAAELSGVSAWNERLSPAPLPLRGGAGAAPPLAELGLRASELAVPVALPAGARLLAGIGMDEAADQPDAVIWQRPVGRGRLVVSGALDAWRFRGGASGFDEFWRHVVADAAAAAPAAIDVAVEPRVARPGAGVNVEVTLRELALRPVDGLMDAAAGPGDATGAGDATARIAAFLERDETDLPVRLWPAAPGRLRGRLRLPDAPGNYRLTVETDAGTGSADLLILSDALPVARGGEPSPALLQDWAAAQGGALVPAARPDELVAALEATLTPRTLPHRAHPLRSGWWIIPFALALGTEWWLRRRRGAR